MTWVAVMIGGAIGTAARHAVNVLLSHLMERPVPWAVAAVNLIGSGAIGVIAGLTASGRLQMSLSLRAFVVVGILGGFTTFSSLMLDSLTLSYTGETGVAVVNILGQLTFGLAAVWAGYFLGLGFR